MTIYIYMITNLIATHLIVSILDGSHQGRRPLGVGAADGGAGADEGGDEGGVAGGGGGGEGSLACRVLALHAHLSHGQQVLHHLRQGQGVRVRKQSVVM